MKHTNNLVPNGSDTHARIGRAAGTRGPCSGSLSHIAMMCVHRDMFNSPVDCANTIIKKRERKKEGKRERLIKRENQQNINVPQRGGRNR